MTAESPPLEPSPTELLELVRIKHGDDPGRHGWGTRMRIRFGYYTPDDVYEATVAKLVTPGCAWLDVGCGRDIFRKNRGLARALADRSGTLVGVDPDATIEENTFVHRRARCTIDAFRTDETFDLVTLRMVAEHITDPAPTLEALARLTRPGGRVVIYTVNRWSPVPLVAWAVPFGLHHPVKRLLWGSEEKDTFPVAYRMNTRGQLRRLFEGHGFREAGFSYLDDCRTFTRFRALFYLELSARRALKAVGARYPENCLLGIYERLGEAPGQPSAGGRDGQS